MLRHDWLWVWRVALLLFALPASGQAGATMPEVVLEVTLCDSDKPSATTLPSQAETGADVYTSIAGDAVFARYTISNKGPAPVKFVTSDLTPTAQNFVITTSASEHVKSGLPKVHNRGRVGDEITIRPGEAYCATSNLLDLFPPEAIAGRNAANLFRPGLYQVCMTINAYEDKGKSGLWVGKLNSSPISWRVKDISQERRRQLWKGLEKVKGAERSREVMLLLETAAPSWNDQVGHLLVDAVPEVRMAAAFFVARIERPPEAAIKALQTTLAEDSDSIVRACAAYALGESGAKDAVPSLIMAVKSRKERSYREAVRALGKLGDERAIPVLQEVANTDPEEWVRKAAEDSISSIRAANKPQG